MKFRGIPQNAGYWDEKSTSDTQFWNSFRALSEDVNDGNLSL